MNSFCEIDYEVKVMNDTTIIYSIEYLGNKVHYFIANGDSSSVNYEILGFYPDGKLLAKVQKVNGKINGKAYYFYKSGVIMHERNWINGRKVGLCNDFYDTTGAVKAVLLYNNQGELYYKKVLSRTGEVLRIEGKK
jgi:antitoxin component YwqK of YwqJK toxin-antitoxin module